MPTQPLSCCCILLAMALCAGDVEAQSAVRITILSDAFGRTSLQQDWGFAALIEHGGRRILFDTANNSEHLAANAQKLNVDLTRVDFVVISHRHGDHTDGLRHLLKVNPRLKIYVPPDEYFGGATPAGFFRPDTSLPREMRYFGGHVPKDVPHGTPWQGANFIQVDSVLEVLPGVRLLRNLSQTQTFGETPELSLSIATDGGQLLLVGCSHPGIETILASVNAKEVSVRLLVGGLHLVTAPEAEIDRLTRALRDEWKLGAIAPGHCTGEYAFAALQRAFGTHYRYAGVGEVLTLSPQ